MNYDDTAAAGLRYPGIDLAEGLELFDGDVDLYMKICAQLVREGSERSQAIRQAMREKDRMALIKQVHSLKGVAGNVGACQLAFWAAKKEREIGRTSSVTLDEVSMTEFFSALEKTLASLQHITEDYEHHNRSGENVSLIVPDHVKYIQPELDFSRPVLEKERTTVLIVDDSSTVLGLVSRILKDDYNVKIASNARQGLSMARSEPVPGIILLDVVMPELSGFDLCKILKTDKQTRNIPVVFLSALDNDEDRACGFRLGASDFISKPLQVGVLKEKIQKYASLREAV